MFSIIIPTFNEEDQIGATLTKVKAANRHFPVELIVVDGGSEDDTVEMARKHGAIVIESERKGRGAQMNRGASIAKFDWLYFLHADSIPPQSFTSQMAEAINQGAIAGCFRLAFDYDHWFLKANCWFTRFNINAVRFGDQSLFVKAAVFQQIGGFREDLLMMEDQEIIHRIKKQGRFRVLHDFVITSARKYLDNGVFRMQNIFFLIWGLYYLGCSQAYLLKLHRRLIRRHKL